ncbi:MAG: ABC transporter permease [Planctomycetaceae bacterium]|nr:ABC transporter permease [Planctomycetaceae bacterium]
MSPTLSSQQSDSESNSEIIKRAPGFWDWLKHIVVAAIVHLGDLTMFASSTAYWFFTKGCRTETLIRASYNIGVLSLPVVMLTGCFIGMVLAVQSYPQFRMVSLESRLGAVINMSLVRELGPVLAATMLAGRIGSSIAAELGTMRVTEQIDALASMGTNPVYYLVVPRVLACLFLIPGLTAMADLLGVFGGALYSISILGVESHSYWYYSSEFVGRFDLIAGMIKSMFFGGIIAIISCHQGFNCDPGAEGVGKAATASFVLSFVAILFADLMLGIMLDGFYSLFWSPPPLI